MLTSSRHHIIYEAVQDQTALLFFQWLYRTNGTPDPPLGRRVAGCSPDGLPQYKPTESHRHLSRDRLAFLFQGDMSR